jgi:hypothetical protein
MKCPHCGKDIKEELIMSEAARISGRRSKRTLSPEQARNMALKMHEKHHKTEKEPGNDDNG